MTIISTLIGFILTGLIGNYLVHKWQLRNWLTQQKIITIEKEHLEIKELAESFSSIANERLFSMRAVTHSLETEDNTLKNQRIGEYREAIRKWNQQYGFFSAKLPLLMPLSYTQAFDDGIHKKMVEASILIDEVISQKKNQAIASVLIEKKLIEINRNTIRLTNNILQSAKRKRLSIHEEQTLNYCTENIEKFSNWQLIKALFIKDVNSFSINRSPLEP